MPSAGRLALLALTLLLAALPAQAHGVYEAQALEVHVLDDEGSDAIEAYGGYDIQDLFIGSQYQNGTEGVYVRLELYGSHAQATATMPWRVEVHYLVDGKPYSHILSTTDGATFTHDFACLQAEFEAEEHTLHVQRAMLSNGAPRPGVPLDGLEVRSYWGTDLRDVAPGGIPVPGLGGAAEYPEPTAIAGEGRLVEHPVAAPVDAYFGAVTAQRNGTTLALSIANGLTGGQHVHLAPLAADGWTVAIEPGQRVLDGNATGEFLIDATPAPGAAPLVLEALSDVGGRLLVELHEDGSVHARDAEVLAATPPAPAKESPGPLFVATGLALLVAVLRRRA